MPVVSIRHLTAYRYRNPVALGEHRMMLRPLESYDQRLLSAELSITPEPSVLRPGAPQAPLETLALGTGSCRDFAMLMIEAVRSLGLAARFVSGYVYSSSQKAGRAGGGHTHAWVRVFLPSCGWVEFDPTNGIVG